MIFSTNISVTVEVYRKQYTITFRSGAGLDRWKLEANNPQFYGGKKAFVELTTTRDAHLFDIKSCVKH